MYFADPAPSFGFREAGQVKVFVSGKLQTSSTSDTTTPPPGQTRPPGPNGSAMALAADAGYSITNNLGVYASYRGVNNTYRAARGQGTLDNNGYGIYNGRRVEVGAVHYGRTGPKGSYELMAGGGAGSLQCAGQQGLPSFDARFWRASLQGSFAYHPTSDVVRLYGGLRLTYQQMTRFSSTDPQLRFTLGQPEDVINGTFASGRDIVERPLGLLEPFGGLETGYRWVRVMGQTGFSTRYFGPRPGGMQFYVSFGIGFQWPGGPVPGRAAAD